ncbi:copper resistance protein CopC [Micromonospora sp. NPDC050417]|uniref:copper resistance protein CopC n=1 Tax=Micromonospora sp. NPDC050417 TaxID=3364280 RepID=UPI003788C745
MGGKFTRTGALLVAASAACVFLTASPAVAHNSLTSSDPSDGARLDRAPTRLTLTFLAKLDPGATIITVVGPDNVSAANAEPIFSGSRVVVGFRPGPAGLYTVGYELPSSDGHPVKGRIRFTMTVGASADTAPSPTAPSQALSSPALPPSPSVPTVAAGAPQPAPPSEPDLTPLAGTGRNLAGTGRNAVDEGGPTWWPWALGGVVLLVAGVGGGLLRRRRTRES